MSFSVMPFIPLLQEGQAPAQQNMLFTIAPFAIIIVIFYIFIIRPQNKKQKETEKMINALKRGDKVITIGGIHGVVSSVKEKTVIVKVDTDTKIEINRSAVASVVSDKTNEKTDKQSKKTKKDEVEARKPEEIKDEKDEHADASSQVQAETGTESADK